MKSFKDLKKVSIELDKEDMGSLKGGLRGGYNGGNDGGAALYSSMYTSNTVPPVPACDGVVNCLPCLPQ